MAAPQARVAMARLATRVAAATCALVHSLQQELDAVGIGATLDGSEVTVSDLLPAAEHDAALLEARAALAHWREQVRVPQRWRASCGLMARSCSAQVAGEHEELQRLRVCVSTPLCRLELAPDTARVCRCRCCNLCHADLAMIC